MARTLDRPQEPTFSTVKVSLTHTPPAKVVSNEPFIKPIDQPSQHTDRPATSDLSGTDPPASRHISTSKSSSDRPQSSDRPKASEQTVTSGSQKPSTSAFEPTRKDFSESDSDSDSLLSDRPPVDIYVEEGELSDDQDATITGPSQSLSEEQTYRETMRGFRSFMG